MGSTGRLRREDIGRLGTLYLGSNPDNCTQSAVNERFGLKSSGDRLLPVPISFESLKVQFRNLLLTFCMSNRHTQAVIR